MINSQFSIDYLTRNSDIDDKHADAFGSEGDVVRTPSPGNASELSESESNTSDNTESIAQVSRPLTLFQTIVLLILSVFSHWKLLFGFLFC
jgi:hypothetical protein